MASPRHARVRRLATVDAGLAMITMLLYGLVLHFGALGARPSPNAAFVQWFSWLILGLAVLIGARFAWTYLRVARHRETDRDDENMLRARRNSAVWSVVVLTLVTIALAVFGRAVLLVWALPAFAAALAWTVGAVLVVRASARV